MIPIYKSEIEAGIADKISANASIAIVSSIIPKKISDDIEPIVRNSKASANPSQRDLFYLESILASVGWNSNDDVFDPYEVWAARHTPIDKQFNYMHDQSDIIGHLTSSKIVDFEGNLIADDTPLDDLPTTFDIVVGSVLYRHWADEELQERMDNLIAEIQDNKWYVSMECLFSKFDYALVAQDTKEHQLIARNAETAFLSKHLRAYGGTGMYKNYTVGRLIRNFTFSGKGLVDNPANDRSIITNFNNKSEVSAFAAETVKSTTLEVKKEQFSMANEITYTQAQYDALKKELDEAKAFKQADFEKEFEQLKAELSKANDTVKDLQSKLDANEEIVKAKDEKITAIQNDLEEANKANQELTEQIEASKLEAISASRKSTLVNKGIEDARATELVEKFVNASDEMFEALVESLPDKTADAECKTKMKDKEKEDKAKAEETASEEEQELDKANADVEPDLTDQKEDPTEALRTMASEWFKNDVLQTTAKKQ
jgi:hypothetical protein